MSRDHRRVDQRLDAVMNMQAQVIAEDLPWLGDDSLRRWGFGAGSIQQRRGQANDVAQFNVG
jgi:hypothetical protein